MGQHTAVVWCGLESTTRSCIWQKYEKNTNFGYRTKKSEKSKKKSGKKIKKIICRPITNTRVGTTIIFVFVCLRNTKHIIMDN